MTQKETELLIKLVLSLNAGNCGYTVDRVIKAKSQLDQLKELGCKLEDGN